HRTNRVVSAAFTVVPPVSGWQSGAPLLSRLATQGSSTVTAFTIVVKMSKSRSDALKSRACSSGEAAAPRPNGVNYLAAATLSVWTSGLLRLFQGAVDVTEGVFLEAEIVAQLFEVRDRLDRERQLDVVLICVPLARIEVEDQVRGLQAERLVIGDHR